MPSVALSRSYAPVSSPRARHVSRSPAAAPVRGMPRYLQGQTARVSQPADAGERHAGQIAARVMSDQPRTACTHGLPGSKSDEAIERTAAGHAPAIAPSPSLGGGQPLTHQARAFFEPRFGRDFGAVRVHADEDAGVMARAYSARAFATGRDIVFAPGEYEPGTESGRRLLAHELAHVVHPAAPGTLARVPDAGAATAPADAGVAPAAGVPAAPAAASTPGLLSPLFDALFDPCATAEEAARRDAFAVRAFHLSRYIPSTTFGMFDADYYPLAGLMLATVKIHFNFVSADNTPSAGALLGLLLSGQDIGRFFWSDSEKDAFKSDYISRVAARWSAQHSMVSTKPCWRFRALPFVTPTEVDTDAAAHYVATVHKSAGPGIDYKSGTNDPNVARPDLPATADLYQSDVREEPNFNSRSVATSERQRIEAALTASGASPVLFDKNSDVIRPGARTALTAFATSLKQKNPSDPLIPLTLDAFASGEGDPTRNLELSDRRAVAVRGLLAGLGVPQPMGVLGHGPVGAPDDASNRKVDIAVDHAFETTYAANRYSVGEHEFGHMLGLPDEYQNNTTGLLGTSRRSTWDW